MYALLYPYIAPYIPDICMYLHTHPTRPSLSLHSYEVDPNSAAGRWNADQKALGARLAAGMVLRGSKDLRGVAFFGG